MHGAAGIHVSNMYAGRMHELGGGGSTARRCQYAAISCNVTVSSGYSCTVNWIL